MRHWSDDRVPAPRTGSRRSWTGRPARHPRRAAPLALRSERPLDLRSTLAKLSRGPTTPRSAWSPPPARRDLAHEPLPDRTRDLPPGAGGVRDVVGQAWGRGGRARRVAPHAPRGARRRSHLRASRSPRGRAPPPPGLRVPAPGGCSRHWCPRSWSRRCRS
ncbi:hypothetical protein NKG05_10405 [Oerskovia sp. M15]